MVQRKGGFKRKTRFKLQKSFRSKGKISISKYFQEFNAGDKCALKAESSLQKGMYHPRFHGKVGVVRDKRGECYRVLIKDGGVEKTLIVHPIHLKKL
ncbi:50S ribosomal protein L21e [Candidatus Woesearchaeota archaeon]|nr:50S ribosomal protein L21e [Candidatus Woesearchaeota archaeon]